MWPSGTTISDSDDDEDEDKLGASSAEESAGAPARDVDEGAGDGSWVHTNGRGPPDASHMDVMGPSASRFKHRKLSDGHSRQESTDQRDEWDIPSSSFGGGTSPSDHREPHTGRIKSRNAVRKSLAVVTEMGAQDDQDSDEWEPAHHSKLPKNAPTAGRKTRRSAGDGDLVEGLRKRKRPRTLKERDEPSAVGLGEVDAGEVKVATIVVDLTNSRTALSSSQRRREGYEIVSVESSPALSAAIDGSNKSEGGSGDEIVFIPTARPGGPRKDIGKKRRHQEMDRETREETPQSRSSHSLDDLDGPQEPLQEPSSARSKTSIHEDKKPSRPISSPDPVSRDATPPPEAEQETIPPASPSCTARKRKRRKKPSPRPSSPRLRAKPDSTTSDPDPATSTGTGVVLAASHDKTADPTPTDESKATPASTTRTRTGMGVGMGTGAPNTYRVGLSKRDRIAPLLRRVVKR